MNVIRKSIFSLLILAGSLTGLLAQGDVVITDITTTDVLCGGANDGTLTVTISGGVAPYSYLLTKGAQPVDWIENVEATTHTFFNLEKNSTYIVLVSDSDSTADIQFASIGGPDPIQITFVNKTDISCNNANDGVIHVRARGEKGNLIYELNGPLTATNETGTFPNLPEGGYTVTVSDRDGCPSTDVTGLLVIENPDPIVITVDNVTDLDCFEDRSGAISISVSGGNPFGLGSGYTYDWRGPDGYTSSLQDISNLAAGDYSVTVYDGKLCPAMSGTITLTQPPAILPVLDDFGDVSCNGGSDGSALISVSGGSGTYIAYAWEGQVLGLVSTQQDPINLPADTYNLTITDSDGCTQTFFSFVTIDEPLPITASTARVDIDCYGAANGSIDLTPAGGTPGYRFAWSGPNGFTADTEDISNLEAGAYSVSITDANNCVQNFDPLDSIREPDEFLLTSEKTDISCGGLSDGAINIAVSGGTLPYLFSWTGPSGFTATTEDIANLVAGSYSLTVRDGNGCAYVFTDLETIIEPALISATYVSQDDVDCHGDSTGSIEINASGGIAPLIFNWTNSSGVTVSTDEDPSGLPAGSYSLRVSDANGCFVDYPNLATILEPLPLQSTLSGTDISCFGFGDGTISVTTSGGTPPYEYSIVGETGPYQPGTSFSPLDPGEYTIWTRDANLCTTSNSLILTQPAEIIVGPATRSGDILCTGDSSAQISIDQVTGGVEPYSYSINGGMDYSPNPVFTKLPAGTYQIRVMDASGCSAPGGSLEITEPPPLQIGPYDQVNISSCYDALEGEISIEAFGGTGIITYTLDGSISNTSGEFLNLAGGSHLITMEDENGCRLDTTVIILAPPPILLDLILTDVTGCNGDASGVVNANGSGGNGSISYSLNGGVFQDSGIFSGLPAGNYTLTLRDDGGCTLDTSFSLREPAPISQVFSRISPISCAGANDGIIEVLGEGGTPPLTYTLTPGAISNNTGLFPALAPGTYAVRIGDSQGCPGVDTVITLVDPPLLSLNAVTGENISCYGAADGRISISVSGGVPPYEFSVDNQVSWGSDSLITGLGPGTYEIYVRDANLCTPYGGSLILSEPPEISLSVTVTDIQGCSGDSTGSIEVLASGGTGILEYSLDNLSYQSSGSFTNLTAGLYVVYVRDETGCFITRDVPVTEPEALTANIIKSDAIFGNLGTITITESAGGTPPYLYSIGGDAGPFTSDTAYTDLEAGTYHVILRDSRDCSYEEMIEILDVPPLEVIVNISHVSCYGENDGSIEFVPQDAEGAVSYSIDSGRNFVPDPLFENLPGNTTYYLVALDEAGKLFLGTATIFEPEEIILTSTVTPAECNAFSNTGSIEVNVSGGTGPFTFRWTDGFTGQDRINVGAGTYTLEVTDRNNCMRSEAITVGSQVSVFAYAGEDTTICFGESLQLNASGRHTPSWDPSPFISDPTEANPLTLGITQNTRFVLTITEEVSVYNCYNKDSIEVSLYPQTGLIATRDTFIIRGTSVQLEVFGGPFQDYRWEPETGLSSSSIPDPLASPLESITYYVYGTNEHGCEETDSVYIEVIEDLRAYNVFTPNGDGINDYFEIQHAERFPEMQVEVYNRWGSLLFSSKGYYSGRYWYGTSRGKEVPVGTYYYIIIPYTGAEPITGHVTIIR